MASAATVKSSVTMRRLMAEARLMRRNPSPHYHAAPLDGDLFRWHFTVRGPGDSPFEGGTYHGELRLPLDFPHKPPDFIFLTPNGRFEVGKKICLNITNYHPESWDMGWRISSMLLAISAFFQESGKGAVGAVEAPEHIRKELATKSTEWKCSKCGTVSELVLPMPKEEGKDQGKAKEHEGRSKGDSIASKSNSESISGSRASAAAPRADSSDGKAPEHSATATASASASASHSSSNAPKSKAGTGTSGSATASPRLPSARSGVTSASEKEGTGRSSDGASGLDTRHTNGSRAGAASATGDGIGALGGLVGAASGSRASAGGRQQQQDDDGESDEGEGEDDGGRAPSTGRSGTKTRSRPKPSSKSGNSKSKSKTKHTRHSKERQAWEEAGSGIRKSPTKTKSSKRDPSRRSRGRDRKGKKGSGSSRHRRRTEEATAAARIAAAEADAAERSRSSLRFLSVTEQVLTVGMYVLICLLLLVFARKFARGMLDPQDNPLGELGSPVTSEGLDGDGASASVGEQDVVVAEEL